MQKIHVNVSDSYDVTIGNGLLQTAGTVVRQSVPKAAAAAVVTDDRVGPLYARTVTESLEAAGLETFVIELPHGEQHKNAESYLRILNEMADRRLTRTDCAVALGGGVIGDMTGFAAATYLRGIRYVQLPTSLLAMVDASTGGKTAIDLPAGKNLAGAFCQPASVLCDISALDTLPAYYLTDGTAEVIKAGVLRERELFFHLMEKGTGFDREQTIAACIVMKRDYVEADEFDTGIRRELNLGHTVGHAVEKYSNYAVSHGRGVSIGLAVIAGAAAAAGICTKECAEQIVRCLQRSGLPVRFGCPEETVEELILSDKKRKGQKLALIVPERIGKCRVTELPVEEVPAFLEPGFRFAGELPEEK